MHSFIDPPFVSVFVIDKTKRETKYLMIRRSSEYLNGTWQMVTGGVHKGEKAWEAALREVEEETGLVPEKFYSADAIETFYCTPKDKVMFVPAFVAFVDPKDGVRLAPDEHDAYEWLNVDEAQKRLVWAEQRRIIAHVHQIFVLNEPPSILEISLPCRESLSDKK